MQQLTASNAMLRRLRGGSLDPGTAAEQLQGVLARLGISAAELAKLAMDDVVSGEQLEGRVWAGSAGAAAACHAPRSGLDLAGCCSLVYSQDAPVCPPVANVLV